MPLYDYICKNESCLHEELDIKRNVTENVSFFICPKCNSEMKQIYTRFGFKLKGQGWFKDGYSSKKTETPDTKK